MTAHERRQVLTAIAQCDRYIAKEGPRAADLRPEWATKHLAFCHQHKTKLIAMLTEG